MQATAVAHPNIAFVKYWGKSDLEENLPATGSISMTLAGLETKTTVEFVESPAMDSLHLDGEPVSSGAPLERVENSLDLVRERAGLERAARVESRNMFPTAAGLASSASGFAALAKAATAAAGLDLSDRELSALARRGSGSAARSVFGGFVEMRVGRSADGDDAVAEQFGDPTHWDLRCIVAETEGKEKSVGSTDGMLHTERTSPYYDEWLDVARADVGAARDAIEDRKFDELAEITETNCLRMHASAIASDPPIIYWNGATLEVIERIRGARQTGLDTFFTVDAGPHVKAFCLPDSEREVVRLLREIDGVRDIHEARPGPGAKLVTAGEEPS